MEETASCPFPPNNCPKAMRLRALELAAWICSVNTQNIHPWPLSLFSVLTAAAFHPLKPQSLTVMHLVMIMRPQWTDCFPLHGWLVPPMAVGAWEYLQIGARQPIRAEGTRLEKKVISKPPKSSSPHVSSQSSAESHRPLRHGIYRWWCFDGTAIQCGIDQTKE